MAVRARPSDGCIEASESTSRQMGSADTSERERARPCSLCERGRTGEIRRIQLSAWRSARRIGINTFGASGRRSACVCPDVTGRGWEHCHRHSGPPVPNYAADALTNGSGQPALSRGDAASHHGTGFSQRDAGYSRCSAERIEHSRAHARPARIVKSCAVSDRVAWTNHAHALSGSRP
jgi:hypothetical protein